MLLFSHFFYLPFITYTLAILFQRYFKTKEIKPKYHHKTVAKDNYLLKFEAIENFNTTVPIPIEMRMLNFLITKKLGKELLLFIFL